MIRDTYSPKIPTTMWLSGMCWRSGHRWQWKVSHMKSWTLVCFVQACKGEDLGKVEFDEEIKKRFKMVYVPNWFSVDLKTGVSQKNPKRSCSGLLLTAACALVLNRCSQSLWMRATASLPGCQPKTQVSQALMDPTPNVKHLTDAYFKHKTVQSLMLRWLCVCLPSEPGWTVASGAAGVLAQNPHQPNGRGGEWGEPW